MEYKIVVKSKDGTKREIKIEVMNINEALNEACKMTRDGDSLVAIYPKYKRFTQPAKTIGA